MTDTTYIKNATSDVPDSRDFLYEPALLQLRDEIPPPDDLHILDQHAEGACTGFSLAATINLLNSRRGVEERVSARMLYEMAKRHDEWPGEQYDGSSLRGAVSGWSNMGVCAEDRWRYKAHRVGKLTIARAKDARRTTIGAYYRVRPEISHMHAALNEVGVVAVSAQVHKGWDDPKKGRIRFYKRNDGGHAFVIVGYDRDGFWVQNSWSDQWGLRGLALWTYEDWIKNVMDAWVVRLALPTPQIFGLQPRSSHLVPEEGKEAKKPTVRRSEIAGHFVHIDDGRFHEQGPYWSSSHDVEQTAKHIATRDTYPHVVFFCHGGLNTPSYSARRVASMKEGFKRNGIYPYHFMYDNGMVEELKDLILRKGKDTAQRVGGATDWTDRFLEGTLRRPGTLIWDEMKQDAVDAFAASGAGTTTVKHFLRHLRNPASTGLTKEIHVVGHSTGAVVLAYLLKRFAAHKVNISSCSLLAPACTVDLYKRHYLPILKGKTKLKLKAFNIYNLKDPVERDDNVAKLYRKSLLYLVSSAFERAEDHGAEERPLLGMEKFAKLVDRAQGKPTFFYSDGQSGKITRSPNHTDFDNDVYTMNHVLRTILRRAPKTPFEQEELSY